MGWAGRRGDAGGAPPREDGREGTRMDACATRYVGCALKGNTTQMELRLSSPGGCRAILFIIFKILHSSTDFTDAGHSCTHNFSL